MGVLNNFLQQYEECIESLKLVFRCLLYNKSVVQMKEMVKTEPEVMR